MSARPTNRKTEILDVALALAFEGGPRRVTTVAIANRLNLTQPAIYRHFRSKADLWTEITNRLDAEVAGNIAAAESGEGSALARVRTLVLGQLALIERTPALPEIMIARDPTSADAVVRVAMRSRMSAFQATLVRLCVAAQREGALRCDLLAADIAALVMGVLQSLALRLVLTQDPARIAADGRRLLDLQLAAFAPAGAA
ncbi:MAG: TetR/AcrR family transcriptional regulator [Maritimibacter sp.]|nr:TetR/AcrR family transcriptional regulator [Maritimibacter sp.]